MDLREQDERYSSGQQSRTCGAVLTVLAVIGIAVAFAVPVGLIAGAGLKDTSAVMFVFLALAAAAFLWAMATLLRAVRHIEENTRSDAARDSRPPTQKSTKDPTQDQSHEG